MPRLRPSLFTLAFVAFSSAPVPAAPALPAVPATRDVQAAMTPDTALARATAFYEVGQYAQCSDALAELLSDPAHAALLSPRSKEQAAVYRAACLIAQGDTTAADAVFKAAIRENPQMATPSAILFPTAVLERFIVVRTTLLEEIRRDEEDRAFRAREAAYQARRRAEAERDRVARLERLAAEETIVVKNRRWVAMVPFGVGQYQNGDAALGTIFLTTETLAVATSVGAACIELSLNSQAKGGAGLTNTAEVSQLNENLYVANRVALISLGAFAALAAGGIVQANLAFVPEFKGGSRPRRTSPSTGVSPSIAPTVGGAELGLVGRF